MKVEKALECAGPKRGRRISRDVKRVLQEKNECNVDSLDDPVLTGFSDEDSEKAGDGVVVEGND